MAKYKNQEPAAPYDAALAALAATLPPETERDALMAVALAAVVELDRAVNAGHIEDAKQASARYEAVICKLNGGTMFGCRADEDSPALVVERHCAAVPGDVPLWGQRGEFVMERRGVRALVVYDWLGNPAQHAHFAFHAFDLDGPFLSETGYRSAFCPVVGGMSLGEVAGAAMEDLLKKPVKIEAEYLARLEGQPLPAWCCKVVPPARRWTQAPGDVPAGFEFVDVVLPAQKAYIVKQWAAAAAPKVEAARAARSSAKGKGRRSAPAKPQTSSIATAGDAKEPEPCSIATTGDAGPAVLRPGLRCQVVSIHHPALRKEVGKRIVITKVNPEFRSVWAHEDKPVTYRTNRQGKRVVDHDPRCIEALYGFDQIRVMG